MGASWIFVALRRIITRVSYGEVRMQDVRWSLLKQLPGVWRNEKEDLRERRIMVGAMNQIWGHAEKLEDWKEYRYRHANSSEILTVICFDIIHHNTYTKITLNSLDFHLHDSHPIFSYQIAGKLWYPQLHVWLSIRLWGSLEYTLFSSSVHCNNETKHIREYMASIYEIYITYSWPYITTACFWHVIVTAEVYLYGMSMPKQLKHFRTFLKIFIPSIQNNNFYFCTNYTQLKYGNTETCWSKAAIISHTARWYLSENSDFSTCCNHNSWEGMIHQDTDCTIHPTVVEKVKCGAWCYTHMGLCGWGQEAELYSICTHLYSRTYGCVWQPDDGCDDVGMYAKVSVSSCLMLCFLLEQSWAITVHQFPSLSFWCVWIFYYKYDAQFDRCMLCHRCIWSSKW